MIAFDSGVVELFMFGGESSVIKSRGRFPSATVRDDFVIMYDGGGVGGGKGDSYGDGAGSGIQ